MKKRFDFSRPLITRSWSKALQKTLDIKRIPMSWYINIYKIEKFEVSWWEKLLIPNNPYVIKISYFDDEPYYSNSQPERRNFFIEDNNFQDIIDWLIQHSPVANISNVSILSETEFEYIRLRTS